jgi:O-antigen/teichoic acid export membrane protein
MADRIRRLGRETAVYGVSTIVGRFLTFLLTPFYTHLLPPGDLGVVGLVYAYIALMNVVYGYGMESAFMKYVSTLEEGDRRQVFSVPMISVMSSSLAFSALIWANAPALSTLIDLPPGMQNLVVYAAAILFLDACAVIPFAALRMEHKARHFATIKIIGILINVVANIWLLIGRRMGLEGVFIAGVVSSASTLVLLAPTIVSRIGFVWNGQLYQELLRFGLPYVPAGIASMMIQVIDRPILQALKGESAVGIYQANYRLGIFMMLLVSMYDFAWRPFFLSHASDADARQLFARVMTYFVLVATAVFLLLSFFLGDLVRLPVFFGQSLIAEPYWGGLSIVPVVLLAYLFLGLYNNLMAGVYIEKKTYLLPLVTGAGALANVLVNYLLIPSLDLMGAALATLASYTVMAGLLYVLVQRFYRVPYEGARLAKIVGSAALIYLLSLLAPEGIVAVVAKAGLFLLFLFLMWVLRFFTPPELASVRSLFRRS